MNKSHWVALAIAIIFIAFWGFTQDSNEPVSGEPIKIGALLILSGDASAWGENAQKGLMLALEEFNTRGGAQVEIVVEDTGGQNKLAVSGYRKLVDIDKVDALIGPLFQSEVASIAPLVDTDRVPVITPSYAPIENRPNPRNPLMIWMNPTIEAEQMAEYVFNEGIKTVAVIGTRDSWESEISEAFSEKFASLGGGVVSKEIVQPDASEMRLTVTKTLSKEPEAIFVGTYYQFIPTTKIINELGYEGDLFSLEVDSYLAGETSAYSSGLQFISPQFYTNDFAQKFELKYGHKPGIPAGQAYDVMNILMSFLAENKDSEGVLRAMEEFKNYTGVSGEIEVTEDHKTIFPTSLFELQNGEAVEI